MMKVIMETLQTSAIAILNVAIPTLTIYAVKMINQWRERMMAEKSYEEQQAINNRFKRLKAILKDIVLFVEQTEVMKLKESGEWDDENKTHVKLMALDYFENLLSDNDLEFIKENVSDVEEWSSVTLEAIVNGHCDSSNLFEEIQGISEE